MVPHVFKFQGLCTHSPKGNSKKFSNVTRPKLTAAGEATDRDCSVRCLVVTSWLKGLGQQQQMMGQFQGGNPDEQKQLFWGHSRHIC